MSIKAIEIPLFPLNVVLFPGMVLPLHIFEPRYRQMIADCQRQELEFGVALVQPESIFLREEPYTIGTMAEIRDLDRLEDGRLNIIAMGTRRFRILSQHRKKPYLSGLVELYEDVSEPLDDLLFAHGQARSLFTDYIELLLKAANEKDVKTDLPADPEALSYFIAYFLDLEKERQQHFLELTSTLQRLKEEIAILHREVPFLRHILSKQVSKSRSILN
ncbi:MAG TPA: LON peptidase substrate-binding domain-containing protein [Ktedonobacteraceae bacterium]|nr:LON peptidase substrate-binding domain-containing protein [Ktedonobacteraceae bacterium]